MKKIIDYLKGLYIRDGKPARKVLFATFAFAVAIIIAFTNGNTANIYAFLSFTAFCIGAITADKFVQK
jgi:hypothetical protein